MSQILKLVKLRIVPKNYLQIIILKLFTNNYPLTKNIYPLRTL